jgi:chaperonin GroEL
MTDITDKIVLFDIETRDKVLRGVNVLADAVKVTMGPRGRNVLIENPGNHPILTKDGVTVAKSINLRDKVANLGVQMIKEAASRTAEEAGDGTTTATVLTQAMFNEGLKMVAAGYSATDVKKGIDTAVDQLIDDLTSQATGVSSDDEIRQVATVSANGETELGKLIANAILTVGQDGVVTVEEAKGFASSLNVVAGARVERGYLSPYFVTNQDKMVCELDKPVVLICNKRLDSLKEITPFLERILSSQRSLLIIADDIDGDAMQGLVVNKMRGALKVCAIRAPGMGEQRFDTMQDLSVILGTEVVHSSDITRLNQVNIDELGTCNKALISRGETVLVGCRTNETQRESRVAEIRSLLETTPDEDHRKFLRQRLSLLAGGVAVLRVGGATEAELRERRDRVDDALHATQAAMREGILPGGGVALARAGKRLSLPSGSYDAIHAGYQVVKTSCSAPLKQIVQNSGGVADVVFVKVIEGDSRYGYNAYTDTYGDMMQMEIIDPLRVVRCALKNAASAAGMMLTAGCALVEDV